MLIGISFLSSCDDLLPDEMDVFDPDANFVQTEFSPMLGRNTLIENVFNPANSSQPMDFEILNMRSFDGSEAPELNEVFPVQVWTEQYTAEENSLSEILEKRSTQYRKLFSVREHSGDFLMWSEANSSFIKTLPDSGYVFDVSASNTGGSRYYENLRLIPQRERPFEPSVYDPVTGIARESFVHPLSVTNLRGEQSNRRLFTDDIEIYFHKNTDLNLDSNSLTFKFYDKNYNSINPSEFHLTNWSNLVHGFDMEMTDEYVRYKVAYPIPLVEKLSEYTNSSGERAHTVFSYDRLNAGGFNEVASIVFDFSIYEKGHWEIIIVFATESPQFKDN